MMNKAITDKFLIDTPQWVCLQCGYNLIGNMPAICPFCGASHEQFMTWDKTETSYRVTPHTVNDYVSQLLSVPKLGLEHAAYRIETEAGAVWIDSPSSFNRDLAPVDAILFTHHHFMGASNQYRQLWNAQVWLHELDAKQPLAALFTVDRRFVDRFTAYGIDAFPIGGHTPGFTFYIYREVLFICDYVFMAGSELRFNPFGPKPETQNQAHRIHEIIKTKPLKTVCGYNYIAPFGDWWVAFERLLHNR